MTPCGHCLNCLNGAPGICLAPVNTTAPTTATVKASRPIIARYCHCGEPLYGKHRFCGDCRERRRRETWRNGQRRSRHVNKNRLSEQGMTRLPEGEKRGVGTLVLSRHVNTNLRLPAHD